MVGVVFMYVCVLQPAVSVVDHLEQCHRQYLRPPTLDQLSPQTIDSRHSFSLFVIVYSTITIIYRV